MCEKFYRKITDHQSGILKDLEDDKNPMKRAMNTFMKDDIDKLKNIVDKKKGLKDEL